MDKLIISSLIMLTAYLFNVIEKKGKKWELVFPIVILSLISGLRGQTVGTDTYGYAFSIENGFPYGYLFPEEGFRFVSSGLFYLTHNFSTVFLFFALLTNALFFLRMWDFRETSSFTYMSLFYLFSFYINSLNIMRQYAAVAMVFYGTRYLEKNKMWHFLAILALAVSIHNTAILGLAFVFIYTWDSLTKRQKIAYLVPLAFLAVFAVKFMTAYAEEHIDNYFHQYTDNVNITYFYKLFVFVIIMALNYLRVDVIIQRKNKSKLQILRFRDVETLVYVMGIALSSLGMFFLFMSRIGLYYLAFEPVFWGKAVKQGYSRQLALALTIILVIYQFYHLIVLNDCFVFPYYIHLGG